MFSELDKCIDIDDLYSSDYIGLDIETVQKTGHFDELSDLDKKVWVNLAKQKNFEEEVKRLGSIEELYENKGGLYPEFCKIVCVSLGIICNKQVITKSATLENLDEVGILKEVSNFFTGKNKTIVGFNVINFDLDVIFKKMLLYDLKIPKIFDTRHIKPWESSIYDIYLKWKGVRFDYHPSLEMVSNYLGFGTSKDCEVKGEDVRKFYYVDDEEKQKENIKLIAKYCEKDVEKTLNIFSKLRYLL